MSAKLLALCVCPALAVAPLTVPTVRHKAAHHAARVLHKAADRIEKNSAPKADAPCAPLVGAQVVAEPLPVMPLAAETVQGPALLETETAGGPTGEPKPDVWATAEYPIEPFYPIIPGGGGGGGGGGSGGGGADPAPPEPPTQATVPEPASWVMLTTGFGLAGYAIRRQQRQASKAAASKDENPTNV